MTTALRIAHLYPAELGINGDRGNVIALATRLRWRGFDCDVVDVAVGDALPSEIDLVHVGSGPRSARDAVVPDARRHAARLHEWAAAAVPVLAIGAGLQALGMSILAPDGTRREGAGILPIDSVDLEARTVGEVLGERSTSGRFAGFLNHAARLEIGHATPLTVLVRGANGAEGVRTGSLNRHSSARSRCWRCTSLAGSK